MDGERGARSHFVEDGRLDRLKPNAIDPRLVARPDDGRNVPGRKEAFDEADELRMRPAHRERGKFRMRKKDADREGLFAVHGKAEAVERGVLRFAGKDLESGIIARAERAALHADERFQSRERGELRLERRIE